MYLRLLLVGSVSAAAAAAQAGNVCTWTGGGPDNRIQTAANWDVAPVSGNGDELVFVNAAEVVNDVADFSVESVAFSGTGTTTVKGARLSLGSVPEGVNYTCLPWTNACPVVCDAPLLFHNRTWNYVAVTLGADTTFNGDIEVEYPATGGETTPTQRATWGLRFDTERRQSLRIVFNGNLSSPNHALLFNPCSYDWLPQSGMWLYGDVVARTVGARTDGQESGRIHFFGKVTCEELVACYRVFAFERDGLLDPGALLTWASWYEHGRIDLNGHDLTCGQLGGESWNGQEQNDRDRVVLSAAPATLTVAGTASATTYAQICGAANLVYAPASGACVQTFAKRAHTTRGSLTVANGTVRCDDGCAWPNLTRLMVQSGGTFEITAANGKANPFGALNRLGVVPGGIVKIPAGVSFSVPVITSGDALYAEGAVLSGEAGDGVTVVPWIVGAGRITVSATSPGTSFWIGGSGDWSDAAHWRGGVPTADTSAVVDGDGADFTVSVGAADVLPANLTVGNAGGVATVRLTDKNATWNPAALAVNAGGRVELADGTQLTTTGGAWAVNAGGELCLAGGTLHAQPFMGTFAVSGSSSGTGRVTVAAGELAYGVTATWQGQVGNMLQVKAGGEIRATGGTVRQIPSTGASYVRGIHVCGGRLAVSGPAVLANGTSDKGSGPVFGTGESVFDGTAEIRNENAAERVTVSPAAAGETARLVLRGQARFAGGCDTLTVGETAGGTGVVELDSDVVHDAQLGYRVNVGTLGSYGEFNIRRGHARINYRGLLVGGSYGSQWGRDFTATGGWGVFRMSGGALYVQGSQVNAEHIIPGFCVGEGSQVKATGKKLYSGRAEVSGGVITNDIGLTAIGGARSVGVYEQTGGAYLHRNGWNLPRQNYMVGFAGGTGSVTLGGGEIQVASDCYVGGCPLDCIGNGGNLDNADYHYPVEEHDAVGTLTVTGGAFRTTRNLLLGQDGDGTLAVVGTHGRVQVDGALICSNAVMGAGTPTERKSHSTLAFTLDADGVAPVTAGSAELTAGTSVTVDFTAWTGKATRVKLLDAPVTGSVADLDAAFTDGSGQRRARNARLLARSDGLYVTLTSRTLLVIR